MGLNRGHGGCPGEPAADHVHPLWDLPLLRFLLAVPAMPWCRDKYLIRTALKGMLPEAVRCRPKSPLPGFPNLVRARQAPRPELPPLKQLTQYVDVPNLPEWPGRDSEETADLMRALGLHYWLIGK